MTRHIYLSDLYAGLALLGLSVNARERHEDVRRLENEDLARAAFQLASEMIYCRNERWGSETPYDYDPIILRNDSDGAGENT